MSTGQGGPSVMEPFQAPTVNSGHNPDYPGESVSGDTTVQGRDYRAQSVEYFKNQDSSGGTVISYATSGYKSDVAPDCDIDFDDKQAYERIDVIQERRRVVSHPKGSGTCPPPAEMRQPGVLDMPDYVTKKGWLSLKKCLCFFIILSLVTLFIAVVGAAIGIYTFLAVFEGGRILGTSLTIETFNNAALSQLESELAESKLLIQELRSNLSVHANNFEELSGQVASILPSATNAPTTDAPTTANTSTPTNTTDVPPPIATTGISASVFGGCETVLRSQCPVNHQNSLMGGTPGYLLCDTPQIILERSGTALVDVYCNVNNVMEQNPITSYLTIREGRAGCSCYVIASQSPTSDFTCELYATYCPL